MAAPQDPGERPPTQRRQVTAEQLLGILNARLEGYGHCRRCQFAGPIRTLPEPEPDGRNWSRYIPLVCTSARASGCTRAAERIIDDAAAEYSVLETGLTRD